MSTFLQVNFPTPVIGAAGSAVSLSSLLSSAFGENAQFITGAWLAYYGAPTLQEWNFQYWNVSAPSVSTWRLNGTPIAPATSSSFNQTFVNAAQFSNVDVQVGNCIMPNLYMTVRIDRGLGDPVYMEYALSSVSMATPQMAEPGHAPTAAQVVATAISMASQFPNTPNNNDCHWIDTIVGAAAGAPLTNTSGSLDPSQNIEHGFWRIAYRGVPDTNWETLTQPGDIVRFDWANPSDPQHTTLILGAVQPNGSVEVYDNIDVRGGVNYIGRHMADYDVQSVPASVTIYRLTTDDLYLITTTDVGETVLGTTFNDLVMAGGGDDDVRGGIGNDVLLGGADADTLNGGAGVDLLYGEGGNDVIQANIGTDYVFGGAGNDQITSGATNPILADGEGGDDTISTGSGIDYLWGGAGSDTISGGGSGDFIDGGLDNDLINGGEGIDYLYGGDGNDTINGGAAADLITGMAGNDTLLGGTGSDYLYGESGTDQFDLRQDVNFGEGDFDYIADLAAGETIVVPIGSVISYSQNGGDVIFSIGSYSVWVDGGATPLTIAQVQAQTLFL